MSHGSGPSGAANAACGSARTPCRRQVDQILTIRADPVAQHDKLPRRAPIGGPPSDGVQFGHRALPVLIAPPSILAPAPMSIVTRFAPSPTGPLHLGSAYAALTAWRHARAAGGRFLLRLEDIDTGRCRPDFAAAILEDLAWLGLDWDGPVRVQTQHLPAYEATLAQLAARGLLFRCFCTRADIAPRRLRTPWPGRPRLSPAPAAPCRPVPTPDSLMPCAWTWPAPSLKPDRSPGAEAGQGRLACDPAAFGDIVLARRDTPGSYHLCVTQDDAAQGVTLVTRGADLLPSTASCKP